MSDAENGIAKITIEEAQEQSTVINNVNEYIVFTLTGDNMRIMASCSESLEVNALKHLMKQFLDLN